ncbi:MAG TPA: sensor histidine kinase [Rhizomicrobium sp.]|jgi:signal transduction histidine kinase
MDSERPFRAQFVSRLAPRLNSLSGRLIAAAAVWTLLALIVGGLVLSSIFRASVQGDFDSRLKFDLDGLIAAAEPDANGKVALHSRFSDPRFERVYSGWYWQIVPEKPKGDIRISRSLWDKAVRITDTTMRNGIAWGHGTGPENETVRVVARHIEFPITATPQKDDVRTYTFLVAGDMAEVEADVAQFDTMLFWSFAIFGLGLIGAILLQVRIGLLPLRRLSAGLARVREGQAGRLEGHFPSEIAPLARELNSLIDHNSEVVARARTQVSNLAHSLKTPLSVLASEAQAQPGPLANAVNARVGTMRRQIDHYLARARAAGAADLIGIRTAVQPVLEDLARTLSRIHAARAIDISADAPAALAFRGDRQDLEEMAGNLMDNACKWARGRVEARAAQAPDGEFALCVDDDGPGLDAEERARVGARGERLDESVPGSGFGLAIVRDIAGLYGGALELAESPLGGLRARLTLPRAP